jgi:hypothetical protein
LETKLTRLAQPENVDSGTQGAAVLPVRKKEGRRERWRRRCEGERGTGVAP